MWTFSRTYGIKIKSKSTLTKISIYFTLIYNLLKLENLSKNITFLLKYNIIKNSVLVHFAENKYLKLRQQICNTIFHINFVLKPQKNTWQFLRLTNNDVIWFLTRKLTLPKAKYTKTEHTKADVFKMEEFTLKITTKLQ